ncbi:M1-specific T cell receptor alpha chain-like [Sorex fumeus]|uniref:M1-specific T cell receptor alpha chain-like n=1 Tax=Sorex fumeus TaxID=62283 RepID=UPI0024ACC550|nr:M1-specific T cell receptor alpha chain-like [Sorex fumeus]
MPPKLSLLVLWIQVAWVSTQQLEQNPQLRKIQEGENVTVFCKSSSTLPSFQWYRQEPGKGPVLLTALTKGGEPKTQKRLMFQLDNSRKQSSLFITAAQPEDTGIYICAGVDRGSSLGKLYFGRGTQLMVQPDIKDPKPAVYQLTKSKTSNMTVCLVTDFVSNTTVIKKEYGMFSTNTTVLDMKSTESKSNGVLAWDNTASFSCSEPFTVPFYSSSGLSCNATLVEKNFQTDWNLNFQNLLVVTFRILFLKVTGFNLLMTLRLWSC